MPPPPDSGGLETPEETNGIAEAASKFEFTKVECLLFIFHTVAKQAPQFLTDNPEKLKEFKVSFKLYCYMNRCFTNTFYFTDLWRKI